MARARRARAKDNGNQSSRRYWAFCCNPREYRILDAANKLKIDWWQTKGSRIQVGDRVLIWQTRDTQGRRGIVALAEVVQGPEVRSDEGNSYHRIHDKSSIKAQRVGVSYIPLKNYLWSGRSLDEDEFLSSLSVAKARGGITSIIGGDPRQLPSEVNERAQERIADEAKRNAAFDSTRYKSLPAKLEFSDLRELEKVLINKLLWPKFKNRFGSQEALAIRFGQVAALRNALRHSRHVDDIARTDGEAAIMWFERVLSKTLEPT